MCKKLWVLIGATPYGTLVYKTLQSFSASMWGRYLRIVRRLRKEKKMAKTHGEVVALEVTETHRGIAAIAADQGVPVEKAEIFVQHGIAIGGRLIQAQMDAARAANPKIAGPHTV